MSKMQAEFEVYFFFFPKILALMEFKNTSPKEEEIQNS